MTMSASRVAVVRATLGGAFARERGRLALAILAIALGISLGFAIDLVNRTAIAEFTTGMATLAGDADLEVRGPRNGFDENVYPAIARAEGVAVASPIVEITARVHGRSDSITIFGVDAFRAAAVTPALIGVAKDSLELLSPDAIFVSAATLDDLGANVGDTMTFDVGMSTVALRITGLTGNNGHQRYAAMDIGAAQDRFGVAGKLMRIDIRAAPGIDVTSLQGSIARQLPAGVVVAPPQSAVDATTRLSRAYRINLNVLAFVALFTGALLVFSTQSLAVARRRAQFALMRTLGLTQRQLIRLVVGEGAAIGAAGAILGLPVGYVLAQFAMDMFGGDLGAGFFRGVRPQLHVGVVAALVFGVLGIVAAMIGSAIPAREAARDSPATALKAGDAGLTFNAPHTVWPGALSICSGAVATLAPPIDGLPIFGYASIALLLVGTLLLLPRLAKLLLASSPKSRHVPATLAIEQLRDAPAQATVSLAAIVASVALMVSMAIMVASFRHSLDDWLTRVLPADVYLRAGFTGETIAFSPEDQRRIAALEGVQRATFARSQSILLDPNLPRVTLIARTVDREQPLPLVSRSVIIKAGDPPPLWVSEAARDLYAFQPGETVSIPIAGRQQRFTIAGIWRDYVRQQGALLIDRDVYVALTGDADANEAALWLSSGVSPSDIRRAVDRAMPGAERIAVATSSELRQISLRVFDRTFAVTYALEAAALIIGLAGMASSFGALALSRRREFGVLRHLGMTRRQIAAMLVTQGALVSAIGLIVGIALGALISVILIYVVNPQSFHWTMDLSVPWAGLTLFSIALLSLSTITSVVAAREAMSDDAVRVVKDDW